jgi:hypothetical protein
MQLHVVQSCAVVVVEEGRKYYDIFFSRYYSHSQPFGVPISQMLVINLVFKTVEKLLFVLCDHLNHSTRDTCGLNLIIFHFLSPLIFHLTLLFLLELLPRTGRLFPFLGESESSGNVCCTQLIMKLCTSKVVPEHSFSPLSE